MAPKNSNSWKLQDAKARLSEVVRRARAGEPQRVTVHGEEAVVIFDPKRFELRARPTQPATGGGLFEQSKEYRMREGEEIDFDQPLYMEFPDRKLFEEGEE